MTQNSGDVEVEIANDDGLTEEEHLKLEMEEIGCDYDSIPAHEGPDEDETQDEEDDIDQESEDDE